MYVAERIATEIWSVSDTFYSVQVCVDKDSHRFTKICNKLLMVGAKSLLDTGSPFTKI